MADDERTTPDVESDFEALLKDYSVKEKKAEVITKYIAETGSANVFDDYGQLLDKLARFPRDIPPVTRRTILDHWAAQRRIEIPKNLAEEAEMPAEELRKRKQGEKEAEKPAEKYSVDTETGAIKVASTTDKSALTWDEAQQLSSNIKKELAEKEKKGEKKVTYVYDSDTGQVRMAREGETGGTLEQAKELKRMAEEGKEEKTAEKGKGPEIRYVYDSDAGQVRMSREGETGGTLEQAKELKRMAEEDIKREKAEKGKAPQVTYVYDPDMDKVRMAREGEVGGTLEEAKELKRMAGEDIKREKAEKGKAPQVTYVYDPDTDKVRMSREGEVGGTLEEAKELKRMAQEGKEEKTEESPFTMDENGNWMLNPKAKVTGIELMAMESIRRSQERGEAVDPLEMLAQAADKMKVYQEALGGGGKGMPEWMTDPVKFVEMVQNISGGGKGDEGLKQQVASLEKTIADMREDKYREQIEGQQQQIRSLANHISELTDRVADLSRPTTGRTEMDLLHEIATEGIGLAKIELPGMRRDIREALGSTRLPTPKTAEERKESTEKLRQAVKRDKDIEQIGRRLFFGEG